MVKMDSIRELTEKIVHAYHPQQVILFGSYAYGTPTVDSDVDLLVILAGEEKGARKAVEILNTVNPRFPVDLLVRTPEQVQQRLAWNDFFSRRFSKKEKSFMKPLTHEWVEKAEGDFITAAREYRARKSPNYDAVRCYVRSSLGLEAR
jgi:predicted nucleotidyltransferase